ncbi:MAG: FAD-dependent oxidoreductase, partial [Nitrospirota bacterium]
MESPEFILSMPSATLRKPEQGVLYDMLVIGGGPAAMSAVIYAARKMLNLALLSRDFGGMMLETSEVENYLGFQSIDAKDLVARFEDHVRSFDIPILYGVGVREVRKQGDAFIAVTEKGESFSGRTVIVATGERHRRLLIPGGKELVGKGVSYCATCDAPLFKDKRVVIVGGGNSAFTTAIDLIRVNAEITMVNFAEGWQADETMQQNVKKYGRIRFFDSHEMMRIVGANTVESVVVKDRKTGKESNISAEGVFVEIGLLPNSDVV